MMTPADDLAVVLRHDGWRELFVDLLARVDDLIEQSFTL
jgi:hypothetical protein